MEHIVPHDGRSPFDAIRQVDDHGNEWWSARDLMEAMEYTEWRKFSGAIHRAMSSAENRGTDHIVPSDKMVQLGSGSKRRIEDYRLTRFGAYLVVMNGDPRKPEIADAQTYFAVKTREAEVRLPQEDLPDDQFMALAVVKAQQIIARKDEQIAELQPKADYSDMISKSEGLRTINDLANDLKLHAASNAPGVKVYNQQVFDLAGELGLIIRGNTVRHNQPTARAIEANWVSPAEATYTRNSGEEVTKRYARLTPRGYARIWETAVHRLNNNIPLVTPAQKEIA